MPVSLERAVFHTRKHLPSFSITHTELILERLNH